MARPTAFAALVLCCAFAVTSPGAAQPLPRGFSPGTGTIWMGSYSGHLTAVDEATGAATKVPLTTGAPFAVRLSPDRTRFYVQSANMEKFEVVDAVSRRSLDSFTLSDARRHVRALTYEVDPQHKSMVIVAGDTLPPQMEALKAGRSHVQVGQRPFEMGYRAPTVMIELLDIPRWGPPTDSPETLYHLVRITNEVMSAGGRQTGAQG